MKRGLTGSALALLLGGSAAAGGAFPQPTPSLSQSAAASTGGTTFAWIGKAALTPEGTNRFDFAADVAFDASGNVFAGGAAVLTGSNQVFTAAKWSPTGLNQWVRTVTGTGAPNGDVRAIQVDASGGLVAAGRIFNAGTRLDFAVARWDAQGNRRWMRSMSGAESAYSTDQDAANAVAIDAAGDVIAVGQLEAERVDNGSMTAAAVVKLNGTDGTVRWQRLLGDPISSFHAFYTVATDSQDNLIVGGNVAGDDNDSTFRVFKLSGDTGEVLWSASIDDPTLTGGGEQVNRVGVDAEDNVFACGQLLASPRPHFTVVKLAGADGALLWKATPAIDEVRRGAALALAVASDGDAIAGGTYWNDGGDPDSLVIRLDGATGAQVWAQPDPNGALAVDLVLGPGDTVVAAGAARDEGGWPSPLTVRRFAADGTLLSTARLPSAGGRSEARAVAVDPLGNIAAGGSIHDSSLSQSAGVAFLDCTAPAGTVEEIIPQVVPYTGGEMQFSVTARDNVAIGSVKVELTAPGATPRTSTLIPAGGTLYSGRVTLPGNLSALPAWYGVRVVVRDTSGNETELDGGQVAVAVAPAVLRVTPSRLDFGKVRTGKVKRKMLTLRNAGRGQLTGRIVSPAVGFTTDPSLSPSSTLAVPFDLRPGQSKRVAIYFRPEEALSFTENLQVVLDRPEPPTLVSLTGTGTAPRRGGGR